ncbi:Hypothetical predicted protein, partial [Marmota monax]
DLQVTENNDQEHPCRTPGLSAMQDTQMLPMCRTSGQHSYVDLHLPKWGSPGRLHLGTPSSLSLVGATPNLGHQLGL